MDQRNRQQQGQHGASRGDHVYFHHKGRPTRGEVKAVGRHGLTIDSEHGRHKIKHDGVLGVAQRMERKFRRVDDGEDGSIVADEDGAHHYIEGGLPEAEGYLDAVTAAEVPGDGELVTRAMEREMRDSRSWQVLAGEIGEATVLVGETRQGAAQLLSELEQAGITVPYTPIPRTLVDGDGEEHGLLLAFSPEDDQVQDLVNALAHLQRQAAGIDEIVVLGRQVDGMRSMQISTKTTKGGTIMVYGTKAGFETVDASVSPDIEALEKALSSGARVLFLKGGPIANRSGLVLRETTDKAGHQTKRWMRAVKDQPGGKRSGAEHEKRGSGKGYGTQDFNEGDTVAFHGESGHRAGKIVSVGKDGATVADHDGKHHSVEWSKITHHTSHKAPSDDGQKRALPKIKPVPAEKFSAAAHFDEHNDADATPESILSEFGPEVLAKIDDAQRRLKGIEQTMDTYMQDGQYVAERLKLHGRIIESILTPERVEAARPKDGQKPTFTILGGRGGSGKSWLEGNAFDPSTAIVLDADAIKQMLPEYAGWNAFQVHEESSHIFDAITDIAEEMGLNLVHDATMKTTPKAVALVNRFKESGYSVEAHYMHLPRQEAARRAVSRFMGASGRYVPPAVVLSNTSNEKSFDAIKGLVDRWSFYDNQVEKGQDPVLVSRSESNDEQAAEAKRTGRADGSSGLPPGKSASAVRGAEKAVPGSLGKAEGIVRRLNSAAAVLFRRRS